MMVRTRLLRNLLLFPLTLLLLCGMRAQGQSPEQLLAQPIPLDPAVRYGKLDNGMTYYIRANKMPKERAEFYIVHHVGAILEENDQDGLAHFTEHMAFNGTKHFPGKKLLNFLEHNGVKFGADVNAFTTQDMTCYNISDVPTTRKGLLDSCVRVLCDWSGDILFEPAEIDAEREVIVEEWRTRRNADWRINEAKMKLIFKGSKYAERDVIGPITLIKTFDHEALTNFYHKWYRPEFQSIIIVGDFDIDEMEARVKKMAGALPKRKDELEKPTYPIDAAKGVQYAHITDPEAQMLRLELIYMHDPLAKQEQNVKTYRDELIRELIQQMLAERFNIIAQRDDKPFLMARGMYGGLTETRDIFYFISVGMGGQMQEMLKGLLTETQRARQKGFTEGELSRAKLNQMRAIQQQFDERDKQQNAVYVMEYLNNFINNSPAPEIGLKLQLTQLLQQTITVEETNAMIKQLMDGRNLFIMASGPSSQEAYMPTSKQVQELFNKIYDSDLDAWQDNTKDEPLISEQPKPGRVASTKQNKRFGTIEWKLSNGVRVVLKPTKFKDDEVLLRATAPGGLSLVSVDDLVSGKLAGDIVSYCGLGNFDRLELQQALTGKNVHVGTGLSNYSSYVAGSSSAKIDELEIMFQLVYLSFTQPRFEEQGFKTVKDMLKAILENQDKDPNFIFRRKLIESLLENTPRRFELDLEHLKKLDLNRAAKVYTDRFANAQNFTFIITGNIDPNQIKPLVETYLGSLPQGNKEHWRDDDVRPLSHTHHSEFYQHMGTPKSRAALAYIGKAKYNLENLVAAQAIDHIIDLRCIEQVREEHGGTYGVQTDVSIVERPTVYSMLMFLFDTEPEKLDGIIPILEDIFRNVLTNISEVDLDKAKKHLLKSHEERLNRNRYWTGMLDDYEQLGIDRHTDYVKEVNALTKEKLEKKAKQFFSRPVRLDLFMRGIPNE